MLEFECTVLNFENRNYQKKDGTPGNFKSVLLRYKNSLGELVTGSFQTRVDLTGYNDRDVVLLVEPRVYQGQVTGLVVTGEK